MKSYLNWVGILCFCVLVCPMCSFLTFRNCLITCLGSVLPCTGALYFNIVPFELYCLERPSGAIYRGRPRDSRRHHRLVVVFCINGESHSINRSLEWSYFRRVLKWRQTLAVTLYEGQGLVPVAHSQPCRSFGKSADTLKTVRDTMTKDFDNNCHQVIW